jgi:diguanylate cyclase (GGDEF)-like protein
MLDLDSFKLINDAHGHVEGDQYLMALSRELGKIVPENALLARFGNDEFALLLEHTSAQGAQDLAERLRDTVNQFTLERSGRRFHSTVSIGGAMLDASIAEDASRAADPSELVILADTAMHAAKEAGKNRVIFYRPEDRQHALLTQASQWARHLKEAVEENRLALHFQPIVDLSSEKPMYHEALVRLRQHSGRITMPGFFLPAAERFGLMHRIDEWVVERAIDQLVAEPNLNLFVNLSGHSLVEDSLLERIERRLREERLDPQRLVFEITETAAVRDFAKAEQWMNRLRGFGCRFALDDFGSGYASFSCLRSLPVDFVKIDGTFIQNLQTETADLTWVRAMVAVGNTLGKRMVAECVENETVARLVREIGIEFGQGHYWNPPAAEPAHSAAELHKAPANPLEG